MHPFYTRAATMIGEIAAAVSFISKFLRTKGLMSERQLQTFSQSLQELLAGERATAGGRGAPGDAAAHPRAEPSGPRESRWRRARARPRDGGWRAGWPLTAGPGEGLGAGSRALLPPPTAGKPRGEENRRTTKKLKPTESGAVVFGRSADLGDKGAAGLGLVRHPLPPTPSNRCALGGPAPRWESAPLPRS